MLGQGREGSRGDRAGHDRGFHSGSLLYFKSSLWGGGGALPRPWQ